MWYLRFWDDLWNSIYIHGLFWRKIQFWGKSQIPTIYLSVCTSWLKCSYILLLMYIRENYYLCMLVKTYLYVTTNMQCLVEAHLYFACISWWKSTYTLLITRILSWKRTHLYFTLNMHSLGTTYQYFTINMSSAV